MDWTFIRIVGILLLRSFDWSLKLACKLLYLTEGDRVNFQFIAVKACITEVKCFMIKEDREAA